jgi:DNA polymerase-3 subunit delta'
MRSLKDIKGQDSALRYFLNCISSGRLAESYLFAGPDGVGKMTFARTLAAGLFCEEENDPLEHCGECGVCRRIERMAHPDIIHILPEKNKPIKVDQIRQARDALNLKPFEAPYNICMIEEAHMMNDEASNALLKVLEEPPGKALMILVTDRKELLLPTVRSRCTQVRFNRLPIEMAADIISERSSTDSRTALFLAMLSQGAPGVALEMEEKDLPEKRRSLIKEMRKIFESGRAGLLSMKDEERDDLIDNIDTMIMIIRDITLSRAGLGEKVLAKDMEEETSAALFAGHDSGSLYDITGALLELKRAILGYMNPKLAAQVLPAYITGEIGRGNI